MQTLLQISINFPALNSLHKQNGYPNNKHSYKLRFLQPISYYTGSRVKIDFVTEDGFKTGALRNRLSYFGSSWNEDGILVRRGRRVVLVNFKKGFNGIGGGAGDGRVNSETARVLGNLALAILLAYLSMTGQLGWLLDAIVSLWVSLCFLLYLMMMFIYCFEVLVVSLLLSRSQVCSLSIFVIWLLLL